MKRNSSWIAVLPSLVVPVCIGLSLYLGLQFLIDNQTIADEMALRYLTGHPVSRITVGMFLIGMASLAVIGWNIFQQYSSESKITLVDDDPMADGEVGESESVSSAAGPNTSDAISDLAVDHGQKLLDLPQRLHSHYLWERLVKALHSIYRNGSTRSVEEELKYLSDIDSERQQQRYSLVRILIWATPMLGFLGTVLGISQALGGIAVGPDNDFQQMMDGLRGSLYIAFDTTALALTLSMVMMFAQFLVERFESQLLRLVDQRASSEIARQFDLVAGAIDSETSHVVDAIREVVSNQTSIWRDSIRAAEQAWTASLTQTNELVRSNLTESLDENVAALAHYLGEAIDKADQSMAHRWSQWQVALSDNARQLERHQHELIHQTESIKAIVDGLEDTSAFKDAIERQQDAIKVTTKTHDLLNQLLNRPSVAPGEAFDSASQSGTDSPKDGLTSSAMSPSLSPSKFESGSLLELEFVAESDVDTQVNELHDDLLENADELASASNAKTPSSDTTHQLRIFNADPDTDETPIATIARQASEPTIVDATVAASPVAAAITQKIQNRDLPPAKPPTQTVSALAKQSENFSEIVFTDRFGKFRRKDKSQRAA